MRHERDSSGQEMAAFFARHFVSLSWTDSTPGERQAARDGRGVSFHASGFIASLRGEWFLVTAGHILRDIETATAKGQLLGKWRLSDEGRPGGKHQGPLFFDFENAWKSCVFDSEQGFDYAVIHIRLLFRRLLETNGITPLDEKAWRVELPEKFDSYWLLGHPTELTREVDADTDLLNHLMIPLLQVDEPPAVLRKPLPRLYARLTDAARDEVRDIVGMSGGPIFGYKRTANGDLRYWVVAVQSGWSRPDAVIAACPLRLFLEFTELTLVEQGLFLKG